MFLVWALEEMNRGESLKLKIGLRMHKRITGNLYLINPMGKVY